MPQKCLAENTPVAAFPRADPYDEEEADERLAQAIIACLGGYRELAERLGVKPRRVRAWYLHGIPYGYHFDLVCLAAAADGCEVVTIDNLELTCADGQEYRDLRRQCAQPKPEPEQPRRAGGR